MPYLLKGAWPSASQDADCNKNIPPTPQYDGGNNGNNSAAGGFLHSTVLPALALTLATVISSLVM